MDIGINTDVKTGAQCSHCVTYFDAHGYPVLCDSCYINDAGISAIMPALNAEL